MERTLAVDGRIGRARGLLGGRRFLDESGVLIGLVVVAAIFGALVGPQFFRAANLELMARQTVIVCVAALVVALLLRYTRFGRHLFAIGSNERTARLCGVRIAWCKWAVYTIAAAFAGLAGVMEYSKLSVGDPTVAVGLELDVIAAVIIGGGSLSGGKGSVVGTIAGAAIMAVIQIGCSQQGLPNWVQQIVTGSIIVGAVALDRWRSSQS